MLEGTISQLRLTLLLWESHYLERTCILLPPGINSSAVEEEVAHSFVLKLVKSFNLTFIDNEDVILTAYHSVLNFISNLFSIYVMK